MNGSWEMDERRPKVEHSLEIELLDDFWRWYEDLWHFNHSQSRQQQRKTLRPSHSSSAAPVPDAYKRNRKIKGKAVDRQPSIVNLPAASMSFNTISPNTLGVTTSPAKTRKEYPPQKPCKTTSDTQHPACCPFPTSSAASRDQSC